MSKQGSLTATWIEEGVLDRISRQARELRRYSSGMGGNRDEVGVCKVGQREAPKTMLSSIGLFGQHF